jgi:hypothetical protein
MDKSKQEQADRISVFLQTKRRFRRWKPRFWKNNLRNFSYLPPLSPRPSAGEGSGAWDEVEFTQNQVLIEPEHF